ncbi:type II secretion system major pseudopilin GspG [Verrucomicrobiota bacterium]
MNTSRSRSGFTLIELMVVVIIIAALAGMVLPRVLPASESAKRNIAKADLANIKVALKLYRLHNDRYPTTDEGLNVLLRGTPDRGWNEPYLDSRPQDPWDRTYRYSVRDNELRIWSLGPDGQDGTADDVRSWEE